MGWAERRKKMAQEGYDALITVYYKDGRDHEALDCMKWLPTDMGLTVVYLRSQKKVMRVIPYSSIFYYEVEEKTIPHD